MKKNKKWIILVASIAVILLGCAIYYFGFYPEPKSDIYYDLKPLIYLYPKEDTEVTVKLILKDKITVSYPKYEDGWKVVAKPNGDLLDVKTNKYLYGLYWEGLDTISEGIKDYGFVVKGSDTISFLEEKLLLLGLNEREANEFIVYWLPKLEKNKYNYIRFASLSEINKNMPLEVNPKPDTIIRVNMEYKKLDEYIEVEEQKIITPSRDGFVLVEWGGTEL